MLLLISEYGSLWVVVPGGVVALLVLDRVITFAKIMKGSNGGHGQILKAGDQSVEFWKMEFIELDNGIKAINEKQAQILAEMKEQTKAIYLQTQAIRDLVAEIRNGNNNKARGAHAGG